MPSRTTVSWLHFDGIESATEPVPALVAAGATAVELMVAPALMVAARTLPAPRRLDGAAAGVGGAPGRVRGADDAELDAQVAGAEEILSEHELIRPPDFTRDPERSRSPGRSGRACTA